MKLHSFCLGTTSFELKKSFELTEREQNFLNKAYKNLQDDKFTSDKMNTMKQNEREKLKQDMDIDSDESSTWAGIPDV